METCALCGREFLEQERVQSIRRSSPPDGAMRWFCSAECSLDWDTFHAAFRLRERGEAITARNIALSDEEIPGTDESLDRLVGLGKLERVPRRPDVKDIEAEYIVT